MRCCCRSCFNFNSRSHTEPDLVHLLRECAIQTDGCRSALLGMEWICEQTRVYGMRNELQIHLNSAILLSLRDFFFLFSEIQLVKLVSIETFSIHNLWLHSVNRRRKKVQSGTSHSSRGKKRTFYRWKFRAIHKSTPFKYFCRI